MEYLIYIVPTISALGLLIGYLSFRDKRRQEHMSYYNQIQEDIKDIEIRLAIIEQRNDEHQIELKIVLDKLTEVVKELTQ